jgi:hypothetical protein
MRNAGCTRAPLKGQSRIADVNGQAIRPVLQTAIMALDLEHGDLPLKHARMGFDHSAVSQAGDPEREGREPVVRSASPLRRKIDLKPTLPSEIPGRRPLESVEHVPCRVVEHEYLPRVFPMQAAGMIADSSTIGPFKPLADKSIHGKG